MPCRGYAPVETKDVKDGVMERILISVATLAVLTEGWREVFPPPGNGAALCAGGSVYTRRKYRRLMGAIACPSSLLWAEPPSPGGWRGSAGAGGGL